MRDLNEALKLCMCTVSKCENDDHSRLIEDLKGWLVEAVQRALAAEARAQRLETAIREECLKCKVLKGALLNVRMICAVEEALGTSDPVEAAARVRELKAQAAAMRKVIKDTIPEIIIAVNQTNEEIFPIWKNRRIPTLEAAIANDAGRDLLERLRKLEAVAKAVREFVEAWKWHEIQDLPDEIDNEPKLKALAEALIALEGGEQDGPAGSIEI